MFFILHGTFFFFLLFKMHFKMSCANCFNLDQSKILSSGNGFNPPSLPLPSSLFPSLSSSSLVSLSVPVSPTLSISFCLCPHSMSLSLCVCPLLPVCLPTCIVGNTPLYRSKNVIFHLKKKTLSTIFI